MHDEDSSAYRWTDAVLDRHIGRAVGEYSLHAPLEQKSTLTTTAGSRDISIASLADLVDVEAGRVAGRRVPAAARRLQRLADDADARRRQRAVGRRERLRLLDERPHARRIDVDDPGAHDDLVALGAAAYAALDWTSFATNRINTGGDDVWGRYKAFGEERLRDFRSEIRRIGRNNTVRQRRMYTTDAPSVFEQSRVKY